MLAWDLMQVLNVVPTVFEFDTPALMDRFNHTLLRRDWRL